MFSRMSPVLARLRGVSTHEPDLPSLESAGKSVPSAATPFFVGPGFAPSAPIGGAAYLSNLKAHAKCVLRPRFVLEGRSGRCDVFSPFRPFWKASAFTVDRTGCQATLDTVSDSIGLPPEERATLQPKEFSIRRKTTDCFVAMQVRPAIRAVRVRWSTLTGAHLSTAVCRCSAKGMPTTSHALLASCHRTDGQSHSWTLGPTSAWSPLSLLTSWGAGGRCLLSRPHLTRLS